ncbi:hypothetical protein M427DRAFT_184582 [Gonapodya prolifera JEL478]|uniref:WW domain-containing protein n=1 Tax=Gonapodya prolifera (strain JEL478) TaxID=1344416 RepID=A0A139A126_GONPJ|nr:hypothetical protein M427DRAFT_184582 [Gonapodya prolifera JEL478]|eukprot:KXS10225.1 hypothetical protein M427DRAFT_184582 [Gonapodya prolifera JEL478]
MSYPPPPPYTSTAEPPLPPGWVQQFDTRYNRWFYVLTTANPPYTTWTDPRATVASAPPPVIYQQPRPPTIIVQQQPVPPPIVVQQTPIAPYPSVGTAIAGAVVGGIVENALFGHHHRHHHFGHHHYHHRRW